MEPDVPEAVSKALYARLKAALPGFDAVVVTDYGHGMMTPEIVELLCGQDCFLAVNTQTNAANQGFNTVSKYRRADFICISEKELRLEARSRSKDLRLIIAETAEKLSCKRMLITRGNQGCVCYGKGGGILRRSLPSPIGSWTASARATPCWPSVHCAPPRRRRSRSSASSATWSVRRRWRSSATAAPSTAPRCCGQIESFLHYDLSSGEEITANDANRWQDSVNRARHHEKPAFEQVLVTGGAGYVGSVLVPAAAGRRLPREGARPVPLRRRRARRGQGPSRPDADQGRPARPAGGGRGGGRLRRRDPPGLHLQRSELRAQSGPGQVDQLRRLPAAGAGREGRRRAAVHLRLVVERLRHQGDRGRHRGPAAGAVDRLFQVQGDVRGRAAAGACAGLRGLHPPPGHGLRLLAAAAAGPDGEHPHQPRRDEPADQGLRRHARCVRTSTSTTWSRPTSSRCAGPTRPSTARPTTSATRITA